MLRLDLGARPRIPLTVIGGFLGAGKTTLLNHLLAQPAGRRLAVLVNDFGAVNIDAALIASRDANAIALSNGCVCCSIGDDLSAALIGLIESPQPPEAIVIEASGVSDPWRIAQVGLADPALALDAVLVLVDASSFVRQAADPLLSDTLMRQLRAADLLVLNHCDRATAAELAALHQLLDVQQPGTPRIETSQAVVPTVLLGAVAGRDLLVVAGSAGGAGRDGVEDHAAHTGGRHLHSAHCGCPAAQPGRHGAVDHAQLFETWSQPADGVYCANALRTLLRDMPAGVMRLKGLLRTDQHALAVLQFGGSHGSLRAADAQQLQAGATGLVAIGLRGRLPAAALQLALQLALQSARQPAATAAGAAP